MSTLFHSPTKNTPLLQVVHNLHESYPPWCRRLLKIIRMMTMMMTTTTMMLCCWWVWEKWCYLPSRIGNEFEEDGRLHAIDFLLLMRVQCLAQLSKWTLQLWTPILQYYLLPWCTNATIPWINWSNVSVTPTSLISLEICLPATCVKVKPPSIWRWSS
jgi:hypothetical protein